MQDGDVYNTSWKSKHLYKTVHGDNRTGGRKKQKQNTQILYTKQALKIGARRSWKLVVPTNITDQNKMALKYLGFWNI